MARPEQPQEWQPRLPRTWLSLDAVIKGEPQREDDRGVIGARKTTPSYVPDSQIPTYLLDPSTEGEA